MGIYDLCVKDAKGADVRLSDYRGKVLLVVNTATGCGFTPQYTGLQQMYDQYRDKGFEILDFPCNQFGNQAPGTNDEIVEFCTSRFGITFRQFDKVDVNGENESPLFAWLKQQKSGLGGSDIKWNFSKFLVDGEGKVVKRYASTKAPEAISKDVAKLLA